MKIFGMTIFVRVFVMKLLVRTIFFSTPNKNANSLFLNLNGIQMLLGQKRIIIILIIVTIFSPPHY
jgi:hypothetical protein